MPLRFEQIVSGLIYSEDFNPEVQGEFPFNDPNWTIVRGTTWEIASFPFGTLQLGDPYVGEELALFTGMGVFDEALFVHGYTDPFPFQGHIPHNAVARCDIEGKNFYALGYNSGLGASLQFMQRYENGVLVDDLIDADVPRPGYGAKHFYTSPGFHRFMWPGIVVNGNPTPPMFEQIVTDNSLGAGYFGVRNLEPSHPLLPIPSGTDYFRVYRNPYIRFRNLPNGWKAKVTRISPVNGDYYSYEAVSVAGIAQIDVMAGGWPFIWLDVVDHTGLVVKRFVGSFFPGDEFRAINILASDPYPGPAIDSSLMNEKAEFEAATAIRAGVSFTRRPDAASTDYLTAFSYGPREINDSSEGLLAAIWRVRVSGRDVYLKKEGADEFFLFSYTGDLFQEVDLAFDQLGAPIVVTERDEQIWIYFFDAAVPGFVFQNFGEGRNPKSILDDPTDLSASDVLIFYVSETQDAICYRRQGDKYQIEYRTILTHIQDVFLEEVARTVDRRLRIYYSMRWAATHQYWIDGFASALYPIRTPAEGLGVSAEMVAAELDQIIIQFELTESVGVWSEVALGEMRTPLIEQFPIEGVGVSNLVSESEIRQTIITPGTNPSSNVGVVGAVASGICIPVVIYGLSHSNFVKVTNEISSAELQTV